MLDLVAWEFRHASRSLAKTPGLSLTVVLTLAVGISTSAVFFGFFEGVWTRPLPGVSRPAELVHVTTLSASGDSGGLSYPEFLELHSRSRSFAALAATQRRGPLVRGDGFVDATLSNVVNEGYFTTLGVGTEIGRLFREGDAGSASAPVLVMSHNYWRRRHARDPAIVGQSIQIDDRNFTVVGVAAKGFRGTELWTDIDLWIPMASWEAISPGEAALHAGDSFEVMGRLSAGTKLRQAQAEADVMAGTLFAGRRHANVGQRLVLRGDLERRLAAAGSAPLIGSFLVGLVLLVACGNAAGLLMARGQARQHATATTIALGCARRRLIGQALAESAILVSLAGAVALFAAHWGIRGLAALLASPEPTLHNEFYLDQRVALFALVVSAMAVVLTSLGPAFQATRTDVLRAMRGAAPAGRRRLSARHLLVGGQMAVSMFLLALAALSVRSLINVDRADLGFERRRVLVVDLVAPYGPARSGVFYGDLLGRLRGLPGVKRACLALRAPLSGSGGGSSVEVSIRGREELTADAPMSVGSTAVGPGYFELLGTRLVRGRDFAVEDGNATQRVVILNETMARRFWPEQDPIGTTIRIGPPERRRDHVVVGIVRDSRIVSVTEKPRPYLYLALAQSVPTATVLVESAGDPLALVQSVREVVRAVDSNVVWRDVTTLGLLIRASAQPQENAAIVALLLGTLGLLLAALGLYAVVSHAVRQRTQELGVRIALGAQRADVVGLVMRQGLGLWLGACSLGVAASLLVTPILAGVLYGVAPRDWLSHVLAAVTLLVAAAFASYLPARRAAKIDPMRALRCE